MKNKFLISALFIAISSSTVYAATNQYEHGFVVGYAQTDLNKNVYKDPKGANIKYHFNETGEPLGFIVSATYTKSSASRGGYDYDATYYSGLAGPSYTFNNMFRVYALFGAARADTTRPEVGFVGSRNFRRTDFSYGGGIQLKVENLLFDVSITHADFNQHLTNLKANSFSAGVGMNF